MNFIEDVLQRFPFSRQALIEIDSEGERHVHHFSELFTRSLGLSGAMHAQGVHRGDVVMTLVGNRVEWVITMLACFRVGAVALPCSTQLRRADLQLRVASANPALAIGEPQYLGELPGGVPYMDMDDLAGVFDEDRRQETPAEAADLDPEDPALIVFTSGTAGEPRGVLHPQRYLTGQEVQAEHWLGAGKNDLVWCTTASGWSKSARNVFIAPWLRGARAMIHHGGFDPESRLDLIEREGITVLCQAPTEYRMIAKRSQPRPLPALRRMVSAGEPLDAETIGAFREVTGIQIADGYGQTETGHVAGMRPDDEGREGSMGRPLPGFETRVEQTGELQLKPSSCPTFFSRYLDGEPFSDDWWPTGDFVRQDEEGYLWYEGRGDDVIVSAGYRIGPFEVESALVSHPAVAEAAAVAAPDAERGSVVRAIVVLRDGEPGDRLARELQEHVKRVTAPYKYPRIVEFAQSLPKTASGKVKRAELRGS